MVYCGKPSRACAQCKGRKIRCDFKEVCRPCIRANLTCSGPRDPGELVFRDQSRSVVQKALKNSGAQTVPASISLPINDRARDLFFSRYVTGTSESFDYIQSFALENDQHLNDSITAASLAYLSTTSSSAHVLAEARTKYISALQQTNRALRTPDLVTKDTTLLAVLLLDLFEKLTKTPYSSGESWTKHINGALELVKLRGNEQFNNAVGLRMFSQLCSTILISCVQFDIAIPADFIDLRDKANKYLNTTDPKSRLTDGIINFVGFRVALKTHPVVASEAIFMAKQVDDEFVAILESLPLTFQYHTVWCRSDISGAYQDFFHLYSCRRVTHIWNLLRIMRIILNEFIWTKCSEALEQCYSPRLEQTYKAQIVQSSKAIRLLAADICAAVPQYTSYIPAPEGPISESLAKCATGNHYQGYGCTIFCSDALHKCHSMAETSSQAAQCYSVIFPLYVTGQSRECTETMREWIIKRLHSISSMMRIKEALMVAGALERREDISPWAMYALIGSYSFSI